MTLNRLITIGLAAAALTFGVQGVSAMSDASERAKLGGQVAQLDAFERSDLANQSSNNPSTYRDVFERTAGSQGNETFNKHPDAIDRALAGRTVSSGPLTGHRDRYELNMPNGSTVSTGSSREIEWPQVGIGFAVGIVFALGLILAAQVARKRQLAHG